MSSGSRRVSGKRSKTAVELEEWTALGDDAGTPRCAARRAVDALSAPRRLRDRRTLRVRDGLRRSGRREAGRGGAGAAARRLPAPRATGRRNGNIEIQGDEGWIYAVFAARRRFGDGRGIVPSGTFQAGGAPRAHTSCRAASCGRWRPRHTAPIRPPACRLPDRLPRIERAYTAGDDAGLFYPPSERAPPVSCLPRRPSTRRR